MHYNRAHPLRTSWQAERADRRWRIAVGECSKDQRLVGGQRVGGREEYQGLPFRDQARRESGFPLGTHDVRLPNLEAAGEPAGLMW